MNIFAIIFPLVIVALIGFVCTKSQWFSRVQLDALTKFTFYISIPAFLFLKMAQADFSEHVSIGLFAAFYLPVLLCYFIAWLVNFYIRSLHNKTRVSHQQMTNSDAGASAIFALGGSYSNTVIVGLPVLLMALGEQVVPIVFLIVTFHSAIIFTVTSAITSQGHKFNWLNFIKQIINNPVIISILSGLLFNILGLMLPAVITDSLQLIGKPAISLALFILGASLTFYQVKNELKLISVASLLKLLLLPTLVYLFSAKVFVLEPMIITVLVILSASPTGVNAYLVAKNYGQHQETVAGTVVVTTLFSILTIPAWLWWLTN
jgi:predicted permease